MVRVNRRRSIASLSATVAMLLATATHAQTFKFELPAQPLQQSLRAISQQANVNILFDSDTVDGLYAPALNGDLTVQEAIRLLTSDKKLTVQQPAQDTITVSRLMTATSTRMRRISDVREQDRRSMRVAQASAAEEQTPTSASADSTKPDTSRIQLEEVVVTGSHIRGAQNLSSPVLTFDREDIDRSGYSTTQQFIQSLPQNLNSVSDTTYGGGGLADNVGFGGSGINLRGLGSQSTLVLLNGRRMAAAGSGSFVDVSTIPLSAIERIDVLTDGASAIYGSDAVGGVVNIVLRRDFEGAESKVRYGSVTEGDHDELQASQLVGHGWNSGQALLGYEYYKRSPLNGTDRSVFQPTMYLPEIELLPGQKRHGVFAFASQRISERVELSGDVFYGQRKSGYSSGPNLANETDTKVEQFGGSAGLAVDVGESWQWRFSALIDESESHLDSRNRIYDHAWSTTNESQLWSFDLSADGTVASAPGGEARLALGGNFRSEKLTDGNSFIAAKLDRQIVAAYAELQLPLVGAANRWRAIERFEITFAGRFEDYDDFGSAFTPKIGLSWAPMRDLNVRGTWGTSFQAPLLSDINPLSLSVQVEEGEFLDAGERVTGMTLSGGGVSLGPEKSTNWTVGFDFSPAALRGVELSATYFDVDFEDRVSLTFPSGYNVYDDALHDPLYARFITRNPDPQLIAELMANPNASCWTIDKTPCMQVPTVAAIIDWRRHNIAETKLSGIDLAAGYRWSTEFGEWGVQFSGSRQLENMQRIVPGAQATEEMNNVWRPVDLRLRSALTFSRGPLNVNAMIHYTDGYRDRRPRSEWAGGPLQRETVASWTTVDLTARYDFTGMLGRFLLKDASLSLGVINALDREPPFVGSSLGLYYDGVNASPLGRFVSATVTARW